MNFISNVQTTINIALMNIFTICKLQGAFYVEYTILTEHLALFSHLATTLCIERCNIDNHAGVGIVAIFYALAINKNPFYLYIRFLLFIANKSGCTKIRISFCHILRQIPNIGNILRFFRLTTLFGHCFFKAFNINCHAFFICNIFC